MKKIILLSVIALFSVCTQVFSVNYYIRMSTNTSDWSNITPDATHVIVDYNAGADFAAIINGSASYDVTWVAKGTYTIAATIKVKTFSSLIGGFSGTETASSLLSTRPTSDIDGNGIIEPWEFTNATEIVSANTTNNFVALEFWNLTNTVVDGITIKGIQVTTSATTIVSLTQSASGAELRNSIIKDCSVSRSDAAVNGAVNVVNGAIINCLIQSNTSSYTGTGSANSFGGGLSLIGGTNDPNNSSPKVVGCVIRGNKSNNTTGGNARAGGVYINALNTSSFPKMINCLVYNNETNGQGGGLYFEGVNSEAINCTVANNKASLSGGGVFFLWYGIFNNSIVWGNIEYSTNPHDIYFGGDSSSSYSTDYLAYGYKDQTTNGTFVLPALANTKTLALSNTVDGTGTFAPKFINPTSFAGVPSTTDGGIQALAMTTANYKLGATSPCLDFASNSLLTALSVTTDLLGNSRFINTTADLGPYEIPLDVAAGLYDLKKSINCFSNNHGIQINGLTIGDNVMVYGIAGNLISSQKATDFAVSVSVSKGVYLVRVANTTTKVIVQ